MDIENIFLTNLTYNNLFDGINLNYINKIMNNNIDVLECEENYNNINSKTSNILIKLLSTLNANQKKLLQDYLSLQHENILFQNALAYYLGIGTINKINKLNLSEKKKNSSKSE